MYRHTERRESLCAKKEMGKKEEGRQVEENGRVLVSRGKQWCDGRGARTESDTVRVKSKKGEGFVEKYVQCCL